MEAKPSKMSQKNVVQETSQMKLGKTPSKASLTPSQMSERTRLNAAAAANRDPLDALSRSAQRPQFAERRSGLQDVDDDYLKNVVYAYSKQTRTDSTQKSKVTADMMPAGVPTLRSPHRSVLNNERMQTVPEGAAVTPTPTSTTTPAPITLTPAAQEQGQVAQKQPEAIVAQDQQEKPKGEPIQVTQPQTPQEATPPTSPAAQPQGVARQQGGGGGEPEIYTTCPNCRATLYLVRNIGDPSPYPNPQEGGGGAATPKKH